MQTTTNCVLRSGFQTSTSLLSLFLSKFHHYVYSFVPLFSVQRIQKFFPSKQLYIYSIAREVWGSKIMAPKLTSNTIFAPFVFHNFVGSAQFSIFGPYPLWNFPSGAGQKQSQSYLLGRRGCDELCENAGAGSVRLARVEPERQWQSFFSRLKLW